MECPNCKEQCERDTVDVGVGVIHGPWGCYDCGWSEDDAYNLLKIKQPENGTIDPCGGFTPKRSIVEDILHSNNELRRT